MSDKIRAHVFVSGRVQGVFFRDKTRRKAEELNVQGWVRNLPDGKVEAVFEGAKESVEQMVDWVREGPAFAQVDNMELSWQDHTGEYNDFEIRA
ncbi:MAG: acylphosphatase [Candidatus Pacebacteria bacterium]|jgi:acylphosphatase|nr:acylphosphatase [Candidatus Paceibacterota bacterium]